MRLTIVLCLYCLAVTVGCAQVEPAPPTNEEGWFLHIHVVNPFGQPLAYAVTTFRPEFGSNRKDLSARFRDMTIGPILDGAYEYELTPRDANGPYGLVRGKIFLREQKRWLTVAAYPQLPGDERRPPKDAGGILIPPPKPGKNWVRLTNAFSGQVREETPIATDGTFQFSHEEMGRFIITAFSDERILVIKEVTLRANTEYPIRLETDRAGNAGK